MSIHFVARLFRRSLSLGSALFLVTVASTDVRAQKAGTASQCTVTLADTGVEGLVHDGKGAYIHGIDGTRCTVNPTDSTATSGDLLFTLNYLKGAKSIRSAKLFLTAPFDEAPNRGLWTVGGNFHLKVPSLRNFPIGETVQHRLMFHVPYGGTNYKLRYGFAVGDGTDLVNITRTSATEWTITTAATHRARLWTGGGFGDGTVYDAQGDYAVPFSMNVTLK